MRWATAHPTPLTGGEARFSAISVSGDMVIRATNWCFFW